MAIVINRDKALEAAQREHQQKLLTARNKRRRLVGTLSLCGTGSVLWLVSPAFLASADYSVWTVAAGLLFPGSVASLGWALLTDRTIQIDLRTRHQGDAEDRQRVSVR